VTVLQQLPLEETCTMAAMAAGGSRDRRRRRHQYAAQATPISMHFIDFKRIQEVNIGK
jgi:hypothetical protein